LRTASTTRFARGLGIIAVAGVSALALSSCIPGGPAAVNDINDVKTATIQIEAQGTFIDPGTLDPVEHGSRGSGFFVTSDGIANTNNHVGTGAGTLKVWIGGDQSQEFGATVLGASECLDLAVIKVTGSDFPVLGWYEGDIPQALEVYSAGFPLGDPNFTLTKGIVSKADVPQEDSWASLTHVIEHDARIRGGNSGGPLVAENGHVVGVNYAGNDELDYNFAIHRDEVLAVIDQLKKGENVQSLGINARAMEPTADGALGVWVKSVKAGGIADKAGVEPGDVLVSMGGVTLATQGTLEEYCEVIRTQGNDATIDVQVYRPADNGVYEGQFNGDELVLVEGGADPVAPVDPVGTFVTVENDSGNLLVDVPDTWGQVAGSPFTDSSGVTWDALTVSPDLQAFASTYNVPGVALQANASLVGSDLDGALDAFTAGAQADCTADSSGDYDDGFYIGKFAYFTNCAGTTTDYMVLVADDYDNTHFMVVTIQMVSDADKTTVRDNILNTFFAAY
jgi:serine protease Do